MTTARFGIVTDTGGDFTAVSGPVAGCIAQMHFARGDTGDALDTGCDIRLERENAGVVVADWENVGGSSWTRVPRVLVYDTGGAPIDGASGLTVNQSEGVVGNKRGTLLVWIVDRRRG